MYTGGLNQINNNRVVGSRQQEVHTMVALVKNSNAIEIKRYAQIFKMCYYCGRSGYIANNCWYRGREARQNKL